MPKGSGYFEGYVPGQRRAGGPLIADGDYQLTLSNIGKDGPAGWRQKSPSKFPNRMCAYSVAGTEDPVRGGECRVFDFISLSPGAFWRFFNLAEAANYTGEIPKFKLPEAPGDEHCFPAAQEVDRVLNWIKDHGVTLNAHISHEEWKGQPRNRIEYWIRSPASVAPSGDGVEEDHYQEYGEEEQEPEGAPETARAEDSPPAKAPAPARSAPPPRRVQSKPNPRRRPPPPRGRARR